MTISGALATTLTKPAELRTYQPSQAATAQPQKAALSRRFDSVTISGENSRTFALEARKTLSNEVRTDASSASVSAVREAIKTGTYLADSRETARNMLLW